MNKKYYSSLAILFVGFFLIKEEFRIDGEFGTVEPVMFLLRWIIILAIIVFVTIKWISQTERTKFNFLPLITAIFIGLISLLANWKTNHELKAKDKLTAYIFQDSDPMRSEIRLKENGTYFIEQEFIEWNNRLSGDFQFNSDTLHLDNSIISLSDNTFNDRYILNLNKGYLIPIINDSLGSDTAKWLIIENQNVH